MSAPASSSPSRAAPALPALSSPRSAAAALASPLASPSPSRTAYAYEQAQTPPPKSARRAASISSGGSPRAASFAGAGQDTVSSPSTGTRSAIPVPPARASSFLSSSPASPARAQPPAAGAPSSAAEGAQGAAAAGAQGAAAEAADTHEQHSAADAQDTRAAAAHLSVSPSSQLAQRIAALRLSEGEAERERESGGELDAGPSSMAAAALAPSVTAAAGSGAKALPSLPLSMPIAIPAPAARPAAESSTPLSSPPAQAAKELHPAPPRAALPSSSSPPAPAPALSAADAHAPPSGDAPLATKRTRRARLRGAAAALDEVRARLEAARSAVFQLEEKRHARPAAAHTPSGAPPAAGAHAGAPLVDRAANGAAGEAAADALLILLDGELAAASRLFAGLEIEMAALVQLEHEREHARNAGASAGSSGSESDSGSEPERRSGSGPGADSRRAKRRASAHSLSSAGSFDDELFFAGFGGRNRAAAAAKVTPTLAALQARLASASAEWISVQDEAELLRREQVEDKQLAVLDATCAHAESVMDSLERAVNAGRELGWLAQEQLAALNDARHRATAASASAAASAGAPAGDDASAEAADAEEDLRERAERVAGLLDELREARRKLEVKRGYYFPSVEKAFVGLEAMLKNRLTANGALLRRRHELRNRWKSLRDSVNKFERDLARAERRLRAEAQAALAASASGTTSAAAPRGGADDSMASWAGGSPGNSSVLSAGAGSASSPSRPTKSLLRTRTGELLAAGAPAAGPASAASPPQSASGGTAPSRSISLSSLGSGVSAASSATTSTTPPQKPPKSAHRAGPGSASGTSGTPSAGASGLVGSPARAVSAAVPGAHASPSRIARAVVVPPASEPPPANRYAHIGPRVSSRRPPPAPSPTFGRGAASHSHSTSTVGSSASAASLQSAASSALSSSWQPRSTQNPAAARTPLRRPPSRGVSPAPPVTDSPLRLRTPSRAGEAPSSYRAPLSTSARSGSGRYARPPSRAGSEPPESLADTSTGSAGGWRARVDARLAAQRGDASIDSIGDESYLSTSTVHHPPPRAGSALGFSNSSPSAYASSSSAARPRNGRSGTARPISMLGSYYRPPSVTGHAKEEVEELLTRQEAQAASSPAVTERTSRRQSFIPRLSSNGSMADAYAAGARAASHSVVRRPGSAMSVASTDSLQGGSRIPMSTPQRPRPSAGEYTGASRLTMQTPEPVIAARAQRLSMFAKPSGIANPAQRKTSRPPPTRYNIGGMSSHAPSHSSSTSGTPARQTSGRSTPLSAAALAYVPDATRQIDIGRGAHESTISNYRTQRHSMSRDGATTPTHSERSFGSRSYAGSIFGGGAASRYGGGGGGYDGYQPNPYDDLDVEVARIVNELGVALERLDERLPKGQRLDIGPGKEAQARYLIGGKAVMCKILELHRSGRSATRARKIMVRAEGFWQDLESWLLNKLRQ